MLSDKQRLRQWKKGIHTDADGKPHKLRDMKLNHLAATINSFANLDTTLLRRELKRRQRLSIQTALLLLDAETTLKPTTDRQRRRRAHARKLYDSLEKYSKLKA